MDVRRWLRRTVMLGLFAGTLAWVRAAGFAINRKRAEPISDGTTARDDDRPATP